ncbi:MAG: hypothetical protein Q9187_001014 [Circinaria calcarea]
MNHDSRPSSNPTETPAAVADEVRDKKSTHNVAEVPSESLARAPAEKPTNASEIIEETVNGESRTDSEAETVVPSGKDEGSNTAGRKAFRNEDKSERPNKAVEDESEEKKEGSRQRSVTAESSKQEKSNQGPSTTIGADTNNSSNLSSPTSSQTQADSPKKIRPRSAHIRSSLHHDGDSPPEEARSRKRKRKPHPDGLNADKQPSSPKQDSGPETHVVREPRASRKASHHEISKDRSGSPRSRIPHRAPSAQSSDLQPVHKRRKPPPLLVGHQRRGSEEAYEESDDSGSVHASAHLRRLVSADTAVMSPIKIPHKKLRDKNGRTMLARACATEDVDHAIARLRDRPQDLDIADNAGNTPLQIASLEGNANIVQVLLDAGCDITCKNIDMDTPLIDAVENGHLDVVKLLLKAGLDPRQSNAKGEEPLDLLDPSDDNYEDIKAALMEAKGNEARRKHSEDQHAQTNAGRDSISTHSPRGSPPLYSARSPPKDVPMPRRRTARSEATRNDLLWMNPSPENLRDLAGIGDVEGVNYILDMRPKADIEAVLVAARGGHKVVLELLLAIGRPDPDPNPLQSSQYKADHNTPMLAAIGRGNVDIISLLLSEPGFNPTRRLYKELAYHEIAKERQGLGWQEEYDILKGAYDEFIKRHPTSVSTEGSRGDGLGREVKRSRRNTLSSLRDPNKPKSPDVASKDSRSKRCRLPEGKADSVGHEPGNPERIQHDSRNNLRVPNNGSRDSSAVVSDLENTTLGSPKGRKPKRSSSDGGTNPRDQKENIRPRRKLVSGKVLKSDQEKRRRTSIASEASSNSSQDQSKIKSEEGTIAGDIKVDIHNDDTSAIQNEAHNKRPHRSPSPPHYSDPRQLSVSDMPKKRKRRRMDSNGKTMDQVAEGIPAAGSAAVANMLPTSHVTDKSAPPPGVAPVAFMGNSNVSPTTSSANLKSMRVDSRSPAMSGDEVAQRNKYLQDLRDQTIAEENLLRQQREDQEREAANFQGMLEAKAAAELQERQHREQEMLKQQARESAAREEAERQSRIDLEKEESRLEEQRKAKEAEENARIERVAEEARIETKRKEEELQKRRADLEQLRKEQDRRRVEQEEHDRLARLRRQQEEERRRREALPNGLRRVAELKPEDAKDPKEIAKWLPIFTVTGRQLDPTCKAEDEGKRWIANIQAAPILAITDLGLSEYPAWTRRPTSEGERMSLWRVLRCKLAQVERSPFLKSTPRADLAMDAETQVKYLAVERIFWLKLSDFMGIVSHLPHLASIELQSAPMALMPSQSSPKPNGLINGYSPPATNGLTNGYH